MTRLGRFLFAISPLALVSVVSAQNPAPPPPDKGTEFVNEVMRTAASVHELVKSMNVQKALGSQTVYPPGDPRALQRTAEFMGVGAGVGMALGEMSHTEKGMIIGTAAGTAGGLIVDQILRHQAAKAAANAAPPQDGR